MGACVGACEPHTAHAHRMAMRWQVLLSGILGTRPGALELVPGGVHTPKNVWTHVHTPHPHTCTPHTPSTAQRLVRTHTCSTHAHCIHAHKHTIHAHAHDRTHSWWYLMFASPSHTPSHMHSHTRSHVHSRTVPGHVAHCCLLVMPSTSHHETGTAGISKQTQQALCNIEVPVGCHTHDGLLVVPVGCLCDAAPPPP